MPAPNAQGQHSHDFAYYAAATPDYALANRVDHPKNVIMREDQVLGPITGAVKSRAATAVAHLLATFAAVAGVHDGRPAIR